MGSLHSLNCKAMEKSAIFLLSFVGIILGVSAQTNSICNKLPDLKGMDGNTSCCNFPQLIEIKSMEQCMKEAIAPLDSDQIRQCKSLECMFKKNAMLKADGTLDKAGVEKYLAMLLKGNDEWLQVLKPIALDHCLASIEKDYDKMVTFFKTNNINVGGDKCALKPMLMAICVSAKGFAKCPAKDWRSGPVCDDWKSFLGGCMETVDNVLQFYNLLDKAW